MNELLNDLDDILNHISITIGLSNAPKAKLLHDENNQFLKEYKFFSEKFETQTKQVLKDLIMKINHLMQWIKPLLMIQLMKLSLNI